MRKPLSPPFVWISPNAAKVVGNPYLMGYFTHNFKSLTIGEEALYSSLSRLRGVYAHDADLYMRNSSSL